MWGSTVAPRYSVLKTKRKSKNFLIHWVDLELFNSLGGLGMENFGSNWLTIFQARHEFRNLTRLLKLVEDKGNDVFQCKIMVK